MLHQIYIKEVSKINNSSWWEIDNILYRRNRDVFDFELEGYHSPTMNCR